MKQRLCKCRAMRFSGCSASAEMDIRSAGVRLACHWQDASTCCDRSLARRGAGRYQVVTPCTDPIFDVVTNRIYMLTHWIPPFA